MNWRRGTFRLWVIASAVWLVIAAVISINLLRQVSAPIVFHDGTITIVFPGNTSLPNAKKAVLNYLRTQPVSEQEEFEFRRRAEQENAAPQLKPVTDPAILDELNYGDRAKAIIGSYHPNSYWMALAKSLAIILLPPLSLFAAGMSALWVSAGFRSLK